MTFRGESLTPLNLWPLTAAPLSASSLSKVSVQILSHSAQKAPRPRGPGQPSHADRSCARERNLRRELPATVTSHRTAAAGGKSWARLGLPQGSLLSTVSGPTPSTANVQNVPQTKTHHPQAKRIPSGSASPCSAGAGSLLQQQLKASKQALRAGAFPT